MNDFRHEVLLVDLDKDYISATERKDEHNIRKSHNPNLVHQMGFDLFQQALHNLKSDIELWKASSGIYIELDVKNEIVHENGDDNYYKTSRTYTRVYGILTKPEDLAWMKLQLGDLKPATKLTHGPGRGWQFLWSQKN